MPKAMTHIIRLSVKLDTDDYRAKSRCSPLGELLTRSCSYPCSCSESSRIVPNSSFASYLSTFHEA